MSDHLEEEQRLAVLKQLWQSYGRQATMLLSLFLIGLWVWDLWQSHQQHKAKEASTLYQQLLAHPEAPEAFLALQQENQIPYLVLASFTEAKLAADKGEWSVAQDRLMWALQHAKSAPLKQLARLRMAKVLMAQHQWKAAEVVLSTIEDSAFLALIQEAREDNEILQRNQQVSK